MMNETPPRTVDITIKINWDETDQFYKFLIIYRIPIRTVKSKKKPIPPSQ